MKQQPKQPFKQGPYRPQVIPNEPPTQQTSRSEPTSLPGQDSKQSPSQHDGRTRGGTIPFRQQQPFRMQPQSPQPSAPNLNKVMTSHSYPETGAFLSSQPNLSTFSPDYPQPRRPTPSLLQGNQGVRQGNVSSSDYQTSFSVALAQTQLSQYQSSTSQQQTQQFQQQLLLQQQQLILQQQEMLRQQQTMQTHEHEQAQIGLLLQQILQQQKQLADLEMKVKEKNEDGHEHVHGKESTKTPEVKEQKPKDTSHKEEPSKSAASQGSKTHESSGLPVSLPAASTPTNLNDSQAAKEEKSKTFVPASSSEKPFVPDYARMSQFFTNVTSIQDSTEKSGPKDTIDNNTKDHERESKKTDGEDSTMPKDDCTSDKPTSRSTKEDFSIHKHSQNHKDSDLSEHEHETKEHTEKGKEESETKKEEESEEEETGKEEKSSSSEDAEEARRREIEEQIKHIKELQQTPEKQPPQQPTGYLYEPGKLPVVVTPDQHEHNPNHQPDSAKSPDLWNPHEHVPTDDTESSTSHTDGPNENEHHPSGENIPSGTHSDEPSRSEVPSNSELRPINENRDRKPSFHRQCGHYYETQLSRLGHDTNNMCLNDDESLQALLSTVQGFDNVVKSLDAAKHGTTADGFTMEWKELERLQELDSASMTTHAATMNQAKNRYRDILPWDHTRVKLQLKEESDYINANHLKDITPLTPSFIATQGPIATTLTDFWMMVWEQQSPLIIMLTKEVEGSRLMCHQYWPIDEGHTVLFGPIRVTLKTLRTSPSWVRRIMHVQCNESDDTLVVTHLQFTGWPDYGVPESPADLLTFMNEVRSCYGQLEREDQDKPIIMHCSAGIGRTGTFIVIYAAMQEFDAHKVFVNIPRLVRNLRLQRKYMVQKREQYEFCYKTLLFYAIQFLDLELSSIAMKRKTSEDKTRDTEQVKASAPYLEDEDKENIEVARRDDVFDKNPKDSRRESSNVRFLGELKSDDSLEGEDLSTKKEKREENVMDEQSVSEKYCQGTLETDPEATKKHGGELESTEQSGSDDKRKQSETSTSEPKLDSGAVHIGKGEEVRFNAIEDNDSENEEDDENGAGKDSKDSGLEDDVDESETQGDHEGTIQSSASEVEKKTDEKTSSEDEKHFSDIGGEPNTIEDKSDDLGQNSEIISNDNDSVDKTTDETKNDSTVKETDSNTAET